MGTKAPKCPGCEFVKQFMPHDGGWCQEHGKIAPTAQSQSTGKGQDTVIEKLGGNDLSLLESDREWG